MSILSTVRKATKFAVYDDIRINVKNHQTAPTILPDNDLIERQRIDIIVYIVLVHYCINIHIIIGFNLGEISHPCLIMALSANQKLLKIVNSELANPLPMPPL